MVFGLEVLMGWMIGPSPADAQLPCSSAA